MATLALVRPVTAQSSVGSELCGTSIAEFINSTVALVMALAIGRPRQREHLATS